MVVQGTVIQEVPTTKKKKSHRSDTWWHVLGQYQRSLGTVSKKSWDSSVRGRPRNGAVLGRSWDSIVLGQSWDGAVLGQSWARAILVQSWDSTALGRYGLGTVKSWDGIVLGQ